ncbi:MAG: O-antigen ligase family protein [Planctomycetota bacterium]|jgi:tetratricopeptide (TPR) repeat protein/O-antigen ligase
MQISRREVRTGLRWAALALAAGLVLVGPLPTGSQEEHVKWVVSIAAALLGALAIVDAGFAPRVLRAGFPEGPPWRRLLARARRVDPVLASMCALGVWFLVQLVPLPAGLVALVSPERMRLAEAVSAAAGGRPGSWLPLSVCLKCTRDEFLFLAACVATFFASSRLLRRDGPMHAAMGAVAAAGGLMGLYGFLKLLSGPGGRLYSTYTSANRLAGFLAISAASALGLFLMSRDGGRGSGTPRDPGGEQGTDPGPRRLPDEVLPWPWGPVVATVRRLRDVWLGLAAITSLALVLTLSRFGIASALVGALLALAVFTRRRAFWAGLVGLLVVVALGALLAADPVLERYSLLFESGATGSGRAPCWRMALPLAADFATTGSGAGTFRHAFAPYQEPSLGGWWKFAHNDYLNVLTDCGVVGLAAAVAAAAFLMRRLLSLRRSGDRTTRAAGFAAFLALSTLLVHSFGDYPLRQPANAIALAVLAGAACGRARKRAERKLASVSASPTALVGAPAWRPWAHAAVATALMLALVPVLVRLHLSAAHRAEADTISPQKEKAPSREELERRSALLERSAELDVWDADTRYEAARSLAALAQGRFEGARGPLPEDEAVALSLRAERLLREARATSPLDPRSYYLAAALELDRGRVGSADGLMALASRLGPAWPDVAFHSGRYFLLRWVGAVRAQRGGGDFGVTRWQRGLNAEHDELFARLSRGMSLAVRSRGLRYAVVAMLLDQGLSSREIDLALDPDAEIGLALATALARRGDHARARARFERAFAAQGFVPSARTRVAYAATLTGAGETELALQQFGKALEASREGDGAGESFRDVARSLADIRLPPGHAARLVAFWSAARERHPGEPEALRGLALAELAAGDGDAAFDHMLEYAKATGGADAHAELAGIALRLGRPEVAATFAARAVEIEPREVSHRLLHAEALEESGDREGARAALKATLTYGPRHVGAARRLARLELRSGRHDAVERVWRVFLESGGDRAAAHEGLADHHLALMDRDGARAQLRKALEARPGDARLRARLEDLAE